MFLWGYIGVIKGYDRDIMAMYSIGVRFFGGHIRAIVGPTAPVRGWLRFRVDRGNVAPLEALKFHPHIVPLKYIEYGFGNIL